MGFSILWIFFYHSIFFGKVHYSFVHSLINAGYGGVDFFLFLSSYGLFLSMQRDSNIFCFYKKRLFRIIPTFFVMSLATFIVVNKLRLGWDILSIKFWYGQLYSNWFISAILIFYMFFPFLYNNLIKRPYFSLFSCFFISIVFTYVSIITNHGDIHAPIMLFVTRIPIFFLGAFFAFKNKLLDKSNLLIFLFGIGVLLLVLMNAFNFEYLFNFCFVIIVPGSIILLIRIFDLMRGRISKVIGFFGTISLELYLVHMLLMPPVLNKYVPMFGGYLTVFILLLICTGSSFLLQKILSSILSFKLQKIYHEKSK